MPTKIQPVIPENVAKIDLGAIKNLVQKHLESSNEIKWELEIETSKEKKFYAHPGFLLDPPTERYLSSSNMWDPHEHMTVTHTFWVTIKAQVEFVAKNREKEVANVKIEIHFFKSTDGLICPSLVWVRKQVDESWNWPPFPWDGKDYPIYYEKYDPRKPKRHW